MQEIVADRHNEKLEDIIGDKHFKEIMKEVYKIDLNDESKTKEVKETIEGILKVELNPDVKKLKTMENVGMGEFIKRSSEKYKKLDLKEKTASKFQEVEDNKPQVGSRNEKGNTPRNE